MCKLFIESIGCNSNSIQEIIPFTQCFRHDINSENWHNIRELSAEKKCLQRNLIPAPNWTPSHILKGQEKQV